MKIFLENIPSIFACLWAGVNKNDRDIKSWLAIVQDKGITNPAAIYEINNEYNRFKQFQTNNQLYARLEEFFNCNFSIITRMGRNNIIFKYKSHSWTNMLFLKQKSGDIEYLDMDMKEVFPKLSKTDILVNLPLQEIVSLHGKTAPDGILCDESHALWQEHLQINICVYKLVDSRIHEIKHLISVGSQKYDETINLIGNQTDYEVYFIFYILYFIFYILYFI